LAPRRWLALFQNWEIFATGLGVTLLVAISALALAIFIGSILGVFSSSRSRVLRAIARVYVEFFQNIPLVILAFIMYNALPYAGVVLSEMVIGILGVGMYHGAYVAEVVRAGIGSIPVGQFEAAHSQGFSYFSTMVHIIIPQTIKIILPPLTNQAVNLIKNTSVLAVIAGGDLMYHAKSWSSSSANYAPAYITAGILYFILCFPLATWARNYERRLVEKGEFSKDTADAVMIVGEAQ
jgi:putative glutamine transport system permease protein